MNPLIIIVPNDLEFSTRFKLIHARELIKTNFNDRDEVIKAIDKIFLMKEEAGGLVIQFDNAYSALWNELQNKADVSINNNV